MPKIVAGMLAGAAFFAAQRAGAEQSFLQRLWSERPGQVDCGAYVAADRIGFTISEAGADYLLRFDGSPEVFVLHPDNAAMGGKVLRYDSGDAALQVSGWGGVTLYTDSNPAGLPAMRKGEGTIDEPGPASVTELVRAAQDDSETLAHDRRLDLLFTADWNGLSAAPSARGFALDAMENVARGIARFGEKGPGRSALARRVAAIKIAVAGRETVTLNGRVLVVTFDPDQGYEGRASSRAIARALKSLISGPQKQS